MSRPQPPEEEHINDELGDDGLRRRGGRVERSLGDGSTLSERALALRGMLGPLPREMFRQRELLDRVIGDLAVISYGQSSRVTLEVRLRRRIDELLRSTTCSFDEALDVARREAINDLGAEPGPSRTT